MSLIQKELKEVSTTVKSLSNDIANLQKNTAGIPDMNTQLTQLQTSLNNLQTDNVKANEALKETNTRVEILEEENVMLRHNLADLQSKIRRETNLDEKQLEEKVEKHIRRQNDKCSLLIEGVPESQNEDVKKIAQQIAFDAKVQLHTTEYTEAYRLGKFNAKEKRPRSIKITLTSRSQRNLIYRNRLTIKLNPACSQIWINECLDELQKRNRAEIRAVVDLATSLGKEARAVAETAIISGIRYDHPVLHTLPKNLSLERAFTREIDNRLYFNSEHSVLSSFFPIDIEYNNKTYKNLEQGYQHTRAEQAKNMEVAQAIMANPDPRNCKAQGRKIENNEDWNGLRDEVMQKMIDIKAKNPRVREFLLSTDDKTLIEATGDSYWACGATFRSKKV